MAVNAFRLNKIFGGNSAESGQDDNIPSEFCLGFIVLGGIIYHKHKKGDNMNKARNVFLLLLFVSTLSSIAFAAKTLSDLEMYFKQNGMKTFQLERAMPSVIGASSGMVLEVNKPKPKEADYDATYFDETKDYTVQVYQYDTSDPDQKDMLDSARDNGKIDTPDGPKKVMVNGNMVLLGYENHPESGSIVDLFMQFKAD